MTPTLKDYQAYVEEYDSQYNMIELMGGEEGVAFDIGPKLNKAAFSQAFEIEAADAKMNDTSNDIAKRIARTQLFYASPSQADKQLAIWSNPEAVKLMPEDIKALEGKITREDLLYGSPQGRRLIEFIESEYKRFISEDSGPQKGRASRAGKKVSQLYFGS